MLIPPAIITPTLPTLLKQLTPEKHIQLFQTFTQPPQQTSNLSNNPPTPHSPLSQFNYTKEGQDGS
ncbi:malate:quinone oxidoreductase, partial [Staphylococcus epidermidis]|uniref:malate:quinone oxidoreductase n=1 Tax=Staphylococcus epidermidis TaxID=1282 RepID=UPI0021B372A1